MDVDVSSDPHYILQKPRHIHAVVGTTCILSMIGAILIIFLYSCFCDLRTRARYILMHLSITNLGQATANLIGETVDIDSYFNETNPYSYKLVGNRFEDYLCMAQAFCTLYFTISSMLWMISLAVYLYILILNMQQTQFTRYFVWFCYAFCYALPLLVALWMFFTKRLGYATYDAPGWCTLIGRKPHSLPTPADKFGEFFGYDLWLILTCVVIILLYTSAIVFMRHEVKERATQQSNSPGLRETMNSIDYKFIAIPLMFLLLRIWSLIKDVMFIYFEMTIDVNDKKMEIVMYVLLYLEGIGNCAQGFVDAILFVAFTANARKSLCRCCITEEKQRRRSILYTESIFEKSLQNYQPNRYSPTNTVTAATFVQSTRISVSPEPSTSVTSINSTIQ